MSESRNAFDAANAALRSTGIATLEPHAISKWMGVGPLVLEAEGFS